MTDTSVYWKQFKGKKVRLIIEDTPHPRHKDGIFIDYDSTHIFLEISGNLFSDNKTKIVPFSRQSIKRVDFK